MWTFPLESADDTDQQSGGNTSSPTLIQGAGGGFSFAPLPNQGCAFCRSRIRNSTTTATNTPSNLSIFPTPSNPTSNAFTPQVNPTNNPSSTPLFHHTYPGTDACTSSWFDFPTTPSKPTTTAPTSSPPFLKSCPTPPSNHPSASSLFTPIPPKPSSPATNASTPPSCPFPPKDKLSYHCACCSFGYHCASCPNNNVASPFLSGDSSRNFFDAANNSTLETERLADMCTEEIKSISVSAPPNQNEKSHEEFRLENYKLKGNSKAQQSKIWSEQLDRFGQPTGFAWVPYLRYPIYIGDDFHARFGLDSSSGTTTTPRHAPNSPFAPSGSSPPIASQSGSMPTPSAGPILGGFTPTCTPSVGSTLGALFGSATSQSGATSTMPTLSADSTTLFGSSRPTGLFARMPTPSASILFGSSRPTGFFGRPSQ
ncbi:hypothetical protein Tsubulata_015268 [Turnera subulata]|uniref:Uncharacterized protein n=1 Tax=Turnera subulata TaxID=218843 RepID=A0A9Q0FHJ6_9ROSI|nr:hypothetical protein Tsubulata_015268 [Turnera subulata]